MNSKNTPKISIRVLWWYARKSEIKFFQFRKGSPIVSQRIEIDFVRVFSNNVYGVLKTMQKKNFENSNFKPGGKAIFRSGILKKIFFSNRNF